MRVALRVPPGGGTLVVVALLGAEVGHKLHDHRLRLLPASIGLVLPVAMMCAGRSHRAHWTARSASV
jgi:hypothetical protein